MPNEWLLPHSDFAKSSEFDHLDLSPAHKKTVGLRQCGETIPDMNIAFDHQLLLAWMARAKLPVKMFYIDQS